MKEITSHQGVCSVFITTAVTAVLVLNLSSFSHGGAESAKNWIEVMESSANMITSFDVEVTAKRTLLVAPMMQSGKRIRGQYTMLQKPEIEVNRSRQVFSTARRRVEKYNPTNGSVNEIVVSDEKGQRILYPNSHRANVNRPGGPVLPAGEDYLQTYIAVSGLETIPMILRLRDDVRYRREGENDRYVVLESDPAKRRGEAFSGRGIRVSLDTTANMLPAIVELYDMVDGERIIYNRLSVIERKQVAPGVDVPIRAVTEAFTSDKLSNRFRQVLAKTELTIDLSRSRWNVPIADDTFTVQIPAGTKVVDMVRSVAFVTGKPDPGKNLDDLAANARNLITNIRPAPPRPSYVWVWRCGGIGVIALFGLGAFIIRRHGSSSRSSA